MVIGFRSLDDTRVIMGLASFLFLENTAKRGLFGVVSDWSFITMFYHLYIPYQQIMLIHRVLQSLVSCMANALSVTISVTV